MFLGRVVEPGEPLWLEEDRAWAMALLSEERDTHEACGQPISEAFNPENYGRYTADEAGACYACLALNAKSKDMPPEALWHVHLRRDLAQGEGRG